MLARKVIDLIGQRFGKLIVKEYVGHSKWNCTCDCGNEKIIWGKSLKNGETKSCGCIISGDNYIRIGNNQFTNLMGQKFNKLTVIKPALYKKEYYGHQGLYWICNCDCGNKNIIVRGANLKNNHTASCGCIQKENQLNSVRLSEGEMAFNRIYRTYKSSAKKKGKQFLLTLEYFKILIDNDCFYCGIGPKNISKNYNQNGDYSYNGIDRIDSNLGYTFENTVSCCKNCNFAKRIMSQQDFYSWIDRVYNHIHGLDKGEN